MDDPSLDGKQEQNYRVTKITKRDKTCKELQKKGVKSQSYRPKSYKIFHNEPQFIFALSPYFCPLSFFERDKNR